MPYTYGEFSSRVFKSLEQDPRFSDGLDDACNRGIDETLAESNYGNFEFTTLSVANQLVYQLPADMIFVNFVTYCNIPLDRMTMDEYLQRQAFLNTGFFYWRWPDKFLVKENQDLVVSRTPRESGETIAVYGTIKTPNMYQTTDLLTAMPLRRLYDNAAYHYARFFLLQTDGQDERATSEYKLFEHEIGKSNRRLRGNVKDKVKRMV